MPNPFGITEVDIPGALGAYEAGQTSRVNRLLRMQQAQQAERQAERDAGLDQVIARVTGQQGKTGAAGAYPTPPAASAPSGQPASAPALAPAAAPQALPQLSQEDELALRMGGERGVQIATAIRGMNDQQKALTNRRAMAGGQLASQLQAIVDPAQRAAVFQRDVPLLLANGYTQEEVQALAQEGFSNEVLANHAQTADLAIRLSRMGGDQYTLGPGDVRHGPNGEEIARGLPRFYSVSEGGTVQAAPTDIRGGGGVQYQDGETRTINGVSYTRQGGQWHPTGNGAQTGSPDLDNWNNAGRAGPQGPRTFR